MKPHFADVSAAAAHISPTRLDALGLALALVRLGLIDVGPQRVEMLNFPRARLRAVLTELVLPVNPSPMTRRGGRHVRLRAATIEAIAQAIEAKVVS